MSWLRIDDGFADHPKVLQISDGAFRLHMRAMCWCARQETDGKLTSQAVKALGGSPKLVKELVAVRLWTEVEGEHEIHDFLKYNPSKAQRTAERESTKQRVNKHRNGVTPPPGNAVTDEPCNGVTPRPRNGVGTGVPVPVPVPVPSPERILPVAVSQGPDRSEPAPKSGPTATATATAAPIAERARKVLDNPYDGRYSQPSKWPEVRRIALAWSRAFGLHEPKLRDDVSSDPDLKAVLQALADGYDPAVLEGLEGRARGDEFMKKQRRPGPASFTAAVIRRLLAEPVKASAPNGFEDTGELERALAAAGRTS